MTDKSNCSGLLERTILIADNSGIKKLFRENTENIKMLLDFLSYTDKIEGNKIHTTPSLYDKWENLIKLNTSNQKKALAVFRANVSRAPVGEQYKTSAQGLAKISEYMLSEYSSSVRIVILTEKFSEPDILQYVSNIDNKHRVKVSKIEDFVENEVKDEVEFTGFLQRWTEAMHLFPPPII